MSSSNKRFSRLNSIENHTSVFYKSMKSICTQTEPIPTATKTTNTPNYFDQMLIEGQHMTDEQFEKFLQGKRVNFHVKLTSQYSSMLDCLKYFPQEKIFRTLEQEIRSSARGVIHPFPFLDKMLIFLD